MKHSGDIYIDMVVRITGHVRDIVLWDDMKDDEILSDVISDGDFDTKIEKVISVNIENVEEYDDWEDYYER
mgnify:CR=1 FL=1